MDLLQKLKDLVAALARAFMGLLTAVKLIRDGTARFDALMRSYQERKVQRRVKRAPLQEKMPTSDNRLTYVRMRPTTGDTLPKNMVDELESYIAGLSRKEIRRKLKVEYRDGKWVQAGR